MEFIQVLAYARDRDLLYGFFCRRFGFEYRIDFVFIDEVFFFISLLFFSGCGIMDKRKSVKGARGCEIRRI